MPQAFGKGGLKMLRDLILFPYRLMGALIRTTWFWLFFLFGGLILSAVFGVLRYAIPLGLIYAGVKMMLDGKKSR